MRALLQVTGGVGGGALAIGPGDLGGRGVWFRVQAVAPNQAAADQLCSALQGRETDCLVVQR